MRFWTAGSGALPAASGLLFTDVSEEASLVSCRVTRQLSTLARAGSLKGRSWWAPSGGHEARPYAIHGRDETCNRLNIVATIAQGYGKPYPYDRFRPLSN